MNSTSNNGGRADKYTAKLRIYVVLLLVFFILQSCANDSIADRTLTDTQTEPPVKEKPKPRILYGSDLKDLTLTNSTIAEQLGDLFFTDRLVSSNKQILSVHNKIPLANFYRIAIAKRDPNDILGAFKINLLDKYENILGTSLITATNFKVNSHGFTFNVNANSSSSGKGLIFPYGISVVSKERFGISPLALTFGGYTKAIPTTDENTGVVAPFNLPALFPDWLYISTGYKSIGVDGGFFASRTSTNAVTDNNNVILHIGTLFKALTFNSIRYTILESFIITRLKIEGVEYLGSIPEFQAITTIPVTNKVVEADFTASTSTNKIISFNKMFITSKNNLPPVGSGVNAFAINTGEISGSLFGDSSAQVPKYYLSGNYFFKLIRQADASNNITKETRYYWGVYVAKSK